MAISASLRRLLVDRDRNQCSYCLTTEENCGLKMHIDHIIPEAAGGPTTLDNLCQACFSCNIHKSSQYFVPDPHTGELVVLFHPLKEKWHGHFAWDNSKSQIIGLTACGRATIAALQMNNPTVVLARQRWASAGWHPPESS